jgi:3'-phosphoadenosine 5'-phosphosulfate sulfotransferase (PAPS reductase)/FAD synthetase
MQSSSTTVRFLQPMAARMHHPLPPIAITPEVKAMLDKNAVVAIGVSGGKDSQACALAVNAYLDSVGHTGTRVLVHSDLGRVEWRDSIKICEELAAHLGIELMIVRRKAGDMMDRWISRWDANLSRYRNLSCVKIILPWSTPSMRFCTSELKVDVITAALKKRFPGQDIVNVAGIRREESDARKKMPVSADQAKLKRKGNIGITWNAIIEWVLDDVLASIAQAGLRLHEAYTKYLASRVSCTYCIMSAEGDLLAAAGCADNHALYVEMVELEAASTFAFQGHRWLADAAPHLLSVQLRERVAIAKKKAERRQEIESQIPAHLLYSKGWPTCMPTHEEANLLASVRAEIAQLLDLEVDCTTPDQVLARYAELMAAKAIKEAAKTGKGKRGAKSDAVAEKIFESDEEWSCLKT